ncbi:chemerin-like receptor 1 [Halichoeres trimaculatus]|uniref:chemerin-like receptor 1 n=1 Tax=Halichoeres trimaculatus TaxID=147232 RepID=UPI003D9DE6BD
MEMTTTTLYITSPVYVPDDNGSVYTDEYYELKKSLKNMSLVIYCLAFVLGVLGNGAVIWVTGFKMKKTVNTVWFLNLAVADFLFTASLPLRVTSTAMDYHWPFGKFMCKLNSTMSYLNIFVSVFSLMVISVDRCVSVVWPVWAQNHRNARKASFMCLGVWGLALILSSPYFVFRDIRKYNSTVISCYINYDRSGESEPAWATTSMGKFNSRALSISHFLLGFAIPFTVIVICYGVIIHRLKKNRTLASQSTRTFKIIVAVIVTFFFCWAPYHILSVLHMIHVETGYQSEKLESVLNWFPISNSLAFINSALNPLLYVFVGQDYRDRVCISILKRLEAAFREDQSSYQSDSCTMNTCKTNARPFLNTVE